MIENEQIKVIAMRCINIRLANVPARDHVDESGVCDRIASRYRLCAKHCPNVCQQYLLLVFKTFLHTDLTRPKRDHRILK